MGSKDGEWRGIGGPFLFRGRGGKASQGRRQLTAVGTSPQIPNVSTIPLIYVPISLSKVCESLEKMDRLSNVSSWVVTEDYLKNDVPFLVTDAMDDWPVMNTEEFWFDNVTEVRLRGLRAVPGGAECASVGRVRMRACAHTHIKLSKEWDRDR